MSSRERSSREGRGRRAVAGAIRALACAAGLAAAARAHEGHEALPTKGVSIDSAGGTLVLAPAAHRALGVETADVTAAVRDRRVAAYARLVPAWNRHAFASSGVGGRVAALHVRVGDVVTAGQTLVTLESLELETIQLELLTARAEYDLAARTFERIRALAEVQAAAQRERSLARSQLEQARGAVAVAAAKLRSLGVPEAVVAALLTDADRPLTSRLDVTSPIAGTVMHVDVTVGDVVTANKHLFELVDLAEVWAEIALLERDLEGVVAGQPVDLTLAVRPGERFDTAIHTTGRMLDPRTRQGSAWATLANPPGADARWLPGMTGRALIATAPPGERAAVPAGAIVDNGLERFVLVEEAATDRGHEYRRQAVVVEGIDGDVATLADGAVFPGDRVVTTGSHELGSLFVAGVLRLGPEAEADIGLRTETVGLGSVDEVLEFDATVDVPPGSRTSAAAQVEGRITRLLGRVGREVAEGEVIAEVASLRALELQRDLIQAASQRRFADENVARLAELDAAQSVPRKRLWEAQAEALALAERVEALERSLRGIGFPAAETARMAAEGEVFPALAIRAPAAGSIVRLDAVVGGVIEPDQTVAEIHDARHAWLRGHLTEREVGRLQSHAPENAARVRFVALPGRVLEGRIVRRGNVIDPRHRTLPVWVELDVPPGEVLQHGMLARVSLPLSRSAPAIAVPLSAIARQGTRAYVFVRTFDGVFHRRPVVLGPGDDRIVTVLDGLEPGATVAVAGVAGLQTAWASIR